MAKSSDLKLLDSVDISGIPKTRKAAHEAVLNKLRDTYGLDKKSNVHLDLTYGQYLKRHKEYRSKSGGYIDNRTGKPWNEQTIRTELKSVRDTARQTHQAAHPLSIAGRKVGGVLQRISKFSEAQRARNALDEHLQAKSQNWWQLRNLASELDKDTGLRLHELKFNKRTKLLQDNVNKLENKDISDKYQVPKDALSLIQPNEANPFSEDNLRETGVISDQTPNSAVGGGGGSEDKPSNQLNITVKTDKSVTSNANSVQNEQQIQGSAQVKDNSTAVNAGNNATLKIEGSLERWHRGGGRTLDQANAQTKQWLLDQGFQPDQIRGDLQREAFRELRARGPHFTNKDTLRIGKTVLQRKNQPIEQVET